MPTLQERPSYDKQISPASECVALDMHVTAPMNVHHTRWRDDHEVEGSDAVQPVITEASDIDASIAEIRQRPW